jgi:phenol 2-monooxygenase
MAFKTSLVDLLIIGAGPAGLMAACWASQYGMSTRIIDAKEHRTETGHADGVHSRTLEILDSFEIVDPIMRRGVYEVEMSYWVSVNGRVAVVC